MGRHGGPKTRPEKLKVISGTAQKCRSNPDAPEFEKPDNLAPPGWLREVKGAEFALVEWQRLSIILEKNGVLQETDTMALAQLCQMYGEYVFNVSRQVEVSASFMAQMRLYYAEFGMTPSSRSGIKATKKEPAANPFSRNGRRS